MNADPNDPEFQAFAASRSADQRRQLAEAMRPAPGMSYDPAMLQNVGMGLPTRKPRRSRVYAAGHWRARLAAFLDRVSAWLNPLGDA